VTYSDIFDGFAKVMGSVEQSKAYIQANVAMVPPKLFLRALTAEKLSAQSKNDIQRMDYLKEVRSAYILAHDQLYFPLNIELQKAETRVMTYVGRTEMFEALQTWDAVEMSSFFTTLLAARLTWDGRVKSVLGQIDNKIKDTVEYMADGIRSDLMTRTFKKPGQSAEIYMNATIAIQARAQERYQAMIPEVRAVQETFFMLAEGDFLQARAYVLENFLPRNGLDRTEFMIGLRAYEAALGAMQGIDYIELRLMVNKLHEILCDKGELQARDKWYGDFREKDPRAQFETYETDEIPMMIKSDQRMRDTGNAFENFVVQVLKGKTKYSNALSGSRAKGAAVGNWLERDPDWNLRQPSSIEERVENFKEAYMKQTESRKLEESIKLFKADDE
jgi:predicted metal-dependent HD superfamily phosphohydrolase